MAILANNSLDLHPRLWLTHAKALQTVRRFPRETRRRYAAPKSYALTLKVRQKSFMDFCCRSVVFAILSY